MRVCWMDSMTGFWTMAAVGAAVGSVAGFCGGLAGAVAMAALAHPPLTTLLLVGMAGVVALTVLGALVTAATAGVCGVLFAAAYNRLSPRWGPWLVETEGLARTPARSRIATHG